MELLSLADTLSKRIETTKESNPVVALHSREASKLYLLKEGFSTKRTNEDGCSNDFLRFCYMPEKWAYCWDGVHTPYYKNECLMAVIPILFYLFEEYEAQDGALGARAVRFMAQSNIAANFAIFKKSREEDSDKLKYKSSARLCYLSILQGYADFFRREVSQGQMERLWKGFGGGKIQNVESPRVTCVVQPSPSGLSSTAITVESRSLMHET
jgi:hypothetical protein